MPAESSLNPATTMAFDAYAILPVETVRYVCGTPGSPTAGDVLLRSTIENDYRALAPWRITDPNGNVREALYDALGRVAATTLYGVEDGRPVGDDPLSGYAPVAVASLADVIHDPPKYLQEADSFFAYDLWAWHDRRQPASAIALQRQTFVHDLAPAETGEIEIQIAYTDGFGRLAATCRADDVAPLDGSGAEGDLRWIVSGRTVYNNKALPARLYAPYYAGTPEFQALPAVLARPGLPAPTVLRYDALDRLVRTDTPKGFFSKTSFSSWEVARYDEDDTVLDSAYYRSFPKDPTDPDQKNERDALDKAAAFYDTPSREIFDGWGRGVREVRDNLGAVRAGDLDAVVAGSGTTAQQLFDRLLAAGDLRADATRAGVAWVTPAFQPYSTAFQASFRAAFGGLAAATLDTLKSNALTTLQRLDAAGRPLEVVDPRLLYSNIVAATAYRNFAYDYAMSGDVLATDGADGGRTVTLHDIFGGPCWTRSPRGFEQTVAHDRLQRRSAVRLRHDDGAAPRESSVELFTYGDALPDGADRNLRGRLHEQRDQSGLLTVAGYALTGQAAEEKRQFAREATAPIDWSGDVPLDEEVFVTRRATDALGREVAETTPDGAVARRSYDRAGRLQTVDVTFADGARQPVIDRMAYDANGQKLFALAGNGVSTRYTYESTTERLVGVTSARPAASGPPTTLQDLGFWYDPVGNITRSYDATFEAVFHADPAVQPLSDFGYDALYRLVAASGRQHPGILATTYRNNGSDGDFKQSKLALLPADAGAIETYSERYSYDDGGNLLGTRHAATAPWSRAQEIMPDSNRLKTISLADGAGWSSAVAYDQAGNQERLVIDSSVDLHWSYRD